MTTMKCWGVITDQTGFKAPETVKQCLVGNIYNDSRFANGDPVKTSAIHNIVDYGDYKEIETATGTKYAVYPDDIDPEYERQFPRAYERLRVV